MNRWEKILESRPVPLADHLLEEVAKLFAQELLQWPPPLEEIGDFKDVVMAGQRPSRVHFQEAFRLARWELRREVEAVDDYWRNRRYQERGLVDEDKRPLLFLSRWLVEQLLALGEATQGRVKRERMLVCLEKTERLLEAR
ncbi:MAG: hypothetical protein ACT4TC_12355 [Myxococcaceae bacterium]